MDAPLHTPDVEAELAELRRRAFAPDADIHLDPVALERLHALEQRRREAREDPAASPAPATSDASSRGVADVPELRALFASATPTSAGVRATAAPAARVEMEPALNAPTRTDARQARRRAPLGATVGLLVVGLIAGTVVGMTIPRADPDPPTRTLELSDEQIQTPFWASDIGWLSVRLGTVERFDPYRGMEVWSMQKDSGDRCIVLTLQEEFLANGCAPDGLAPVLDLQVTGGTRPTSDQLGIAEGSLIRLELIDDVIQVRESAGPSPSPSSAVGDPSVDLLDLVPGGG